MNLQRASLLVLAASFAVPLAASGPVKQSSATACLPIQDCSAASQELTGHILIKRS
jgi:hypothetical protein